MKIIIHVGDRALSATLNEGMAARDFAALLPLTVTLTDYARTEKIADLPRPLSREGAPGAFKPSVGDIAYYAPWGNLAIFHKSYDEASGLIALGKLVEGIEVLAAAGPVRATFELAAS